MTLFPLLSDSGVDPDKIFSTFFGSDRGREFGMFFDEDFGFPGSGGVFGRMGGGHPAAGIFGAPTAGRQGGGFGGHVAPEPKQYKIDLNLTLEELYT